MTNSHSLPVSAPRSAAPVGGAVLRTVGGGLVRIGGVVLVSLGLVAGFAQIDDSTGFGLSFEAWLGALALLGLFCATWAGRDTIRRGARAATALWCVVLPLTTLLLATMSGLLDRDPGFTLWQELLEEWAIAPFVTIALAAPTAFGVAFGSAVRNSGAPRG